MYKKPFSMVAIGFVFFVQNVHADLRCAPEEGGGVQDYYEIQVHPFSQEYSFDNDLRIPLVTPVDEEIPVARFHVVVEEHRSESVGPSGPLDLGGALQGAYLAAAREPDKLKEFFEAEGRPLFDEQCSGIIDDTMTRENIRFKTVRFNAPNEEGGIAGDFVQSCRIPTTESRYVEARIYLEKSSRRVRRNHRIAGKLVARFTLQGTGTADETPYRIVSHRFFVSEGPTITPENVPDDVSPEVTNLVAARYRERIEQRVQQILQQLNNTTTPLDEADQDRLCTGDGGEITKPLTFNFFSEEASAPIKITANLERIVNEALGDRCELIDCDCPGIEAGLLSGPWRAECRGQQAGARARCRDTGAISGCHMAGPNASYPE